MKIRFYTDFVKLNNSTKRPDDTTANYLEYDGWFKQSTSLNTPIMQIQINRDDPQDYKYCYIPALKKYYFVQDIVSRTNTIWDYYLTEDCLATHRDNILNSSQYVLRAYKGKNSRNFVDDQIPLTTDYSYNDVGLSGFIDTSIMGDGCFCLGIQKDSPESNNGFVAGSVSYYVMDSASLQRFINALISIDLSGTTGLSKMATFSAVNPIQYIVSCVWLPFNITKILGGVTTVSEDIGVLDWKSGVSGHRLTRTSIYSDRGHILLSSIPKHPQRTTYGTWVDQQASQYALTLRGYGQIALDPIIMGQADKIRGDQYVDLTSGASVLKLYGQWNNDYTQFMSQANAQLGVSIQLSQIQKDVFATTTIAGTSVPIGALDAIGGTEVLTSAITAVAKAGDTIVASDNPVQTATSMASEAVSNTISSATQGSVLSDIASSVGSAVDFIWNEPTRRVRAYEANKTGGLHSTGGHFDSTPTADRATPISDFADKLNSAITSYMHNFGVTTASVGSTGTFASFGGIDELYAYFQLYGDRPLYLVGKPECTRGKLSEYMDTDGSNYFVQVKNPQVEFGNTYEKAKVMDYLTGGCYLV